MQSESTARMHGERIASLEERYTHLLVRINHLDECVDGVKEVAEKNAEIVRSNIEIWNRRWWIGMGVVAGVCVVTGSGTISLKSLLDVLGKFAH